MNGKTEHEAILFFDGYCGLCNASVQFVLQHEKSAQLTFAALQSSFATERLRALQPLPDSLVLYANGIYYTESDAALCLCKYMKWYLRWLLVFLVVPPIVRNGVYRWIAKKRYDWFGRTEYCSVNSVVSGRVLT
jgi:predicted DCC family thiol-disulfide oxidoreductase YuxK